MTGKHGETLGVENSKAQRIIWDEVVDGSFSGKGRYWSDILSHDLWVTVDGTIEQYKWVPKVFDRVQILY